MNFNDHSLLGELRQWAGKSDVRERACAHNLQFDERLPGPRGAFFEAMALASTHKTELLRKSAIDYYKTFVRDSRGVSHCFQDLNAAAALRTLAPELKLIRVEDLREPLEKIPGPEIEEFANQLIHALSLKNAPSRAVLRWFVENWNTRTDILRNPRSFSARKDQCLDEIEDANWADLLRDKLGLADFDATRDGPIPVALMEFEVGDILDQARRTPGLAHALCIPTALDSEPCAQFFPTPTTPGRTPGPLDCGCPMGLSVILDEDALIAEIIHPRLAYKVENIVKIGFIASGLPMIDFKEMRNAHLWALRIEAERDDFGTEL